MSENKFLDHIRQTDEYKKYYNQHVQRLREVRRAREEREAQEIAQGARKRKREQESLKEMRKDVKEADPALKEEYEKIINEFGALTEKDVSIADLQKKYLTCTPAKIPTEISKDRDLCVSVLAQDVRLEQAVDKVQRDCAQMKSLIERTEKKPKFRYHMFEETPVPAEPEKRRAKSTSIFAVYSKTGSIFEFFADSVFGVVLTFILSVGFFVGLSFLCHWLHEYFDAYSNIKWSKYHWNWNLHSASRFCTGIFFLVAILFAVFPFIGCVAINAGFLIGLGCVLAFPFFVLSIIPICIVNMNEKIKAKADYNKNLRDYQAETERIKTENKRNFAAHLLKEERFLQKCEENWVATTEERKNRIFVLNKILMMKQKELAVLTQLLVFARERFFRCPDKYNTVKIKCRLIQLLLDFKATTFTEAIVRMEAENTQARREREEREAREEQRDYNRRMEDMERDRLEAQRAAANAAEKAAEAQRIAVQEAQRQSALIEQAQKNIENSLAGIRAEVEEMNAPSEWHRSSQLTEADIERAVYKALK